MIELRHSLAALANRMHWQEVEASQAQCWVRQIKVGKIYRAHIQGESIFSIALCTKYFKSKKSSKFFGCGRTMNRWRKGLNRTGFCGSCLDVADESARVEGWHLPLYAMDLTVCFSSTEKSHASMSHIQMERPSSG
jgi:hypothetical protein